LVVELGGVQGQPFAVDFNGADVDEVFLGGEAGDEGREG